MVMTRRAFSIASTLSALTLPMSRDVRADAMRRNEGSDVSPNTSMLNLRYRHVDVFSRELMSGNGLTVFETDRALTPALMQSITREMRQFESIFLSPTGDHCRVRARVFTMEEELDFAGHPILGAAAVLHERRFPSKSSVEWTIELQKKTVPVTTTRQGVCYKAEMDQGVAHFGHVLTETEATTFLRALNLHGDQLSPVFPLQQVSTGLPYLIVPITSGLENARISQPGFESLLATVGAKFVYVFDLVQNEGRTWDNQGLVEDIATGSAAGPMGAYLVRHGACKANQEMVLSQGRFVGRSSLLYVTVRIQSDDALGVLVAGDVRPIASGQFGS
jgi:trans-2,3-dihydro-3-hydroxyanthranilate isomerase